MSRPQRQPGLPPRAASAPFAVFGPALIALLIAASCGGPSQQTLLLQGGNELNPTEENTATSVQIVIYQLKTQEPFVSLSQRDLWTSDKEKLGGSLVPDTITSQWIDPAMAEPASIVLTVLPETRFVGVFAKFRVEEGKDWRVCLPVAELGSVSKIMLQGRKIVLERS